MTNVYQYAPLKMINLYCCTTRNAAGLMQVCHQITVSLLASSSCNKSVKITLETCTYQASVLTINLHQASVLTVNLHQVSVLTVNLHQAC